MQNLFFYTPSIENNKKKNEREDCASSPRISLLFNIQKYNQVPKNKRKK